MKNELRMRQSGPCQAEARELCRSLLSSIFPDRLIPNWLWKPQPDSPALKAGGGLADSHSSEEE